MARATMTCCEVPEAKFVVHHRHAVDAVITFTVEEALCRRVLAYRLEWLRRLET